MKLIQQTLNIIKVIKTNNSYVSSERMSTSWGVLGAVTKTFFLNNLFLTSLESVDASYLYFCLTICIVPLAVVKHGMLVFSATVWVPASRSMLELFSGNDGKIWITFLYCTRRMDARSINRRKKNQNIFLVKIVHCF